MNRNTGHICDKPVQVGVLELNKTVQATIGIHTNCNPTAQTVAVRVVFKTPILNTELSRGQPLTLKLLSDVITVLYIRQVGEYQYFQTIPKKYRIEPPQPGYGIH